MIRKYHTQLGKKIWEDNFPEDEKNVVHPIIRSSTSTDEDSMIYIIETGSNHFFETIIPSDATPAEVLEVMEKVTQLEIDHFISIDDSYSDLDRQRLATPIHLWDIGITSIRHSIADESIDIRLIEGQIRVEYTGFSIESDYNGVLLDKLLNELLIEKMNMINEKFNLKGKNKVTYIAVKNCKG